MMENEIYEATYKDSIYPSIHLTDSGKTEHDNSWRIKIESTSRLENSEDKPSQWLGGNAYNYF